MNESKELDDHTLFDLVVAGEANLYQIQDLKERVEQDPLLAWLYKESIFDRQFTEEIAQAACLKVEQIQTNIVDEAREKNLQLNQQRLEEARQLDLGL